MRKFLSLLLVAGCFFTAHAQNAAPATADNRPAPDVLQLRETNYDFGKIPQGRPVTHVFDVVNISKEVIRLDNVLASCGCTTPEWSREPIQPGATTQIKVGYNAASEGAFNKSVTIQFNSSQSKTIVISGTVYSSPTTSAPMNASLSLLKSKNQ